MTPSRRPRLAAALLALAPTLLAAQDPAPPAQRPPPQAPARAPRRAPARTPARRPTPPPPAPAVEAPAEGPIYRSGYFIVTDTSVRQGAFLAVARSRDTIVSTYPRAAREVHYKFSLNGQDNEFRPGTEHTLNVRPKSGRLLAPVQLFGVPSSPPPPLPEEAAGSEEGDARITFRLDLREVLRSFRERGHYDPPQGARIAADAFTGAYVIGDVEPLSWDVRRLRPGSPQRLEDPDGDGIYDATLRFRAEYTRPRARDGRALWARRLDVAMFPELTSPERLHDALYRMSLEELRQLVREDGALSAGAKWPGVWTRDVSFASVLALALVVPDAVRTSLVAKVDSAGRIIQDTGTGGSWPVSTDRMTWALAAWELYAATGDRAWLRYAYDVVRRSAEADRHAAHDPATGLVRGESSFLDWREQSYPRWMQPADIYQGEALGTNAVHHGAYRALADMAAALGDRDAAVRWRAAADTVRRGMQTALWQPERGYFGQFRYGRTALALSPRAEALGEALTILYGAATPAQRAAIVRRSPLVPFGTPTFWPYILGEPLYHNGAIWPFVGAYWTWAAAEAGHTAAVEHGLAATARAAALFLTNKENLVAATGHYEGTALNSDRQLWSVAGTLAAHYRVLFGMRLAPDRLVFRPMVPPAYGGERTLRGVRWRGAMLTVVVRGWGDGVRRVVVDGQEAPSAELPDTLTGPHTVELEMNGRWTTAPLSFVEHRTAPALPVARLRGDSLVWAPVPRALRYVVYRDGRPVGSVPRAGFLVRREPGVVSEWQVAAQDETGLASFLSEPVRVVGEDGELTVEPQGSPVETLQPGYAGVGYLRLTREQHVAVETPVRVARAGTYAVDVRYANGSGPINTGSSAAVRTLLVDGDTAGVLVMPHRGEERWSDWGWSNPVRVRLAAGAHVLRIAYTPLDENMSRTVNTALLDEVRLSRLAVPGARAAPARRPARPAARATPTPSPAPVTPRPLRP